MASHCEVFPGQSASVDSAKKAWRDEGNWGWGLEDEARGGGWRPSCETEKPGRKKIFQKKKTKPK